MVVRGTRRKQRSIRTGGSRVLTACMVAMATKHYSLQLLHCTKSERRAFPQGAFTQIACPSPERCECETPPKRETYHSLATPPQTVGCVAQNPPYEDCISTDSSQRCVSYKQCAASSADAFCHCTDNEVGQRRLPVWKHTSKQNRRN